jgi:hypothetical protein
MCADASDMLTRARGDGRLVTVAELATWLQVERSYVYTHAEELGALRLGSGPRARLRFDLDEVRRRISCEVGRESEPPDTASQAASRRRRPRSMGTNVELVPIRGQIPAQNGSGEAAWPGCAHRGRRPLAAG